MNTFLPLVDGYYDIDDQMVHGMQYHARQLFQKQLAAKREISSVEQFEAHRIAMREQFLEAIGGLPEVRTPLNARCTGTIDRPGYTIEKIIYESLPECYVTAALYVPKQFAPPVPAVLFVHGHHGTAKSAPEYQAVCIDLVQNGFVVFAIDPPGQGERKQYFVDGTELPFFSRCVDEHTFAGLQFIVCGTNPARHFIWDVSRGIDYLLTRSEVDPKRIGCTGNSGGGTQTSYMMLAEPRIAAAVTCTFIVTLESYMKTGQPQDVEQIIWGCFVDGPDHDDYLAAMAPKPILVGAAAYDYFPLEGTLEAVSRAKRIYGLYNADANLDIVIAPTRHYYSSELREGAVNWFKVHLKGESPDFKTGEVSTLPEEELWCTPRGQVLLSFPQSQTLFNLNREMLEAHITPSMSQDNQSHDDADTEKIRETVIKVLGINLNLRSAPIYPRVTWEGKSEEYHCEKIFFFSEPDVVVTGLLIHPLAEAVQTDIVLLENGTNDIPCQREKLKSLLDSNHRLFIFDARGQGAVQVRHVNRNEPPHDVEYKLGCDAMMMKRSTLGMRVFDVLRCYDYLTTREDVKTIGILGIDSGAFFAYFAATLEDGITDLVFENLLYSYHDLVSTKFYNRDRYSLRVMAWGILKEFDIVDLLPCLAHRQKRFVNLRNAEGEILSEELIPNAFLDVSEQVHNR